MTRTTLLLSLGCAVLLAAPAWTQELAADTQPPIQARPGGPDDAPTSEQTVDVARGTRLLMSNNAGEVHVRTWDRDAVRVEAAHGPREQIQVQVAEMTVRVRARTERGPQGLIDYRITVPSWMPVNLSGTYLEATVEGTSAEVTIETVRGSARVRGGSGTISVRSVQGQVAVEGASGRVSASSVNEDVHLTDVSGDVTAETTNGDIYLRNTKSAIVEASTVNGDVSFDGGMQDKGSYRFTTHNGSIRVGLGGAANATVFVRTFRGRFNADFPVTLPEGQGTGRGNMRFNFTMGSGSARVELQTFGGDIFIARNALPARDERRRLTAPTPPAPPRPPGTPRPPAPPPPGADYADVWDHGWHHDSFDSAGIAAEIEAALADADIDAAVQQALTAVDLDATVSAALDHLHIAETVEAALAGMHIEAPVVEPLESVVPPVAPRLRKPQ